MGTQNTKIIILKDNSLHMEKLRANYEGRLRTNLLHLRSNSKINTDAPIDNNGQGNFFSPTDLLAASLASCMLTVVGIAAEKSGFSIDNSTAEIEKHMQSNPRKVQELKIKLHFTAQEYTEKEKSIIEITAKNCPVALSLSKDIRQTIDFIYT